MSSEIKDIQVNCRLTDRQYRRYMVFHVLGDKKAVVGHLVLSLLILVFGGMNIHAGSPILGWLFILLGFYFLVSRYLRFFISVGRITEQFGLGKTPKFFYELTFQQDGFDVRNEKEQARYPFDRICRACFMEKHQIVYLYLTKSNAFLLPYEGFDQGGPEDLKARLRGAGKGDVVEEISK